MKKLIFLFVVVLISTTTTFARQADSIFLNLKFGIRAGYNHTTLEGPVAHGKWKSGGNLGVIADLPLKGNWVARTGIYYTMKGYYQRVQDETYAYNDFNYIELPFLMVYQQPLGKKVKLELQSGLYFSYGISGKIDRVALWGPIPDETFYWYKRRDWGANVGFGIDIWHIYLGGAYDYGFSSIIQHAQHHCIMANIGYNF